MLKLFQKKITMTKVVYVALDSAVGIESHI